MAGIELGDVALFFLDSQQRKELAAKNGALFSLNLGDRDSPPLPR
jgi:hypothetical protein